MSIKKETQSEVGFESERVEKDSERPSDLENSSELNDIIENWGMCPRQDSIENRSDISDVMSTRTYI